jgi:hypothetical protein
LEGNFLVVQLLTIDDTSVHHRKEQASCRSGHAVEYGAAIEVEFVQHFTSSVETACSNPLFQRVTAEELPVESDTAPMSVFSRTFLPPVGGDDAFVRFALHVAFHCK